MEITNMEWISKILAGKIVGPLRLKNFQGFKLICILYLGDDLVLLMCDEEEDI